MDGEFLGVVVWTNLGQGFTAECVPNHSNQLVWGIHLSTYL